jgi:hypothetical protein
LVQAQESFHDLPSFKKLSQILNQVISEEESLKQVEDDGNAKIASRSTTELTTGAGIRNARP